MFEITKHHLTIKSAWGMALLASFCMMSACGNKDTVNSNQPNDEITAHTIDCQSADAINSIRQAVMGQIRHQAGDNVEQISQQTGLSTANLNLNDSLSQMLVNITDSQTTKTAGQCQVNLAIAILPTDIQYANNIFQGTQGKNLAEKLAENGYQLQQNQIVAENLLFNLTNLDGGYQTNHVNADGILNIVAEVFSNSQLNQMMSMGKKSVITGSKTPKITETENPPQTNMVVNNPETQQPTTETTKPDSLTTKEKDHATNPDGNAELSANQTSDVKKNKATNATKAPPKELAKKLPITTISETKVIFDAQTGEIISNKTTTSNSGDARKIIQNHHQP